MIDYSFKNLKVSELIEVLEKNYGHLKVRVRVEGKDYEITSIQPLIGFVRLNAEEVIKR